MVGASGQVGHCVVNELTKRGLEAVGTYNTRPREAFVQLQLNDEKQIDALIFDLMPDVVFFCASLTHVDYCESHPSDSYVVNVKGARLVAQATERVGGKFVFLSTDYVFNGRAGPYVETDSPAPINVFGTHKLPIESLAIDCLSAALVARTTWVYSYERPEPGKNFVQRLVASLSKHETVRVPNDQFGNPTYAPDLAERLVITALDGASGLVHLAGQNLLSRYEFACHIAKCFRLDEKYIMSVSTSELNQAARRPLKAGLRSIRTISLPGYDSGLSRMIAESKL